MPIPGRSATPLPLPRVFDRRYLSVVVAYHLVAALAVLPWLFSWTGVALLLLGTQVFGVLGINICYHRMLAHRGLTCPTWFERFLAILGCCALQDSPARWVAIHRRHHQFADESDDPHSPQVNFFWGHMAWLLYENRDLTRYGIYERFAKDLLRDRFYVFLDRWFPLVVLASWVVFFVGGFGAELLMGGGTADALRFGLSVLIWGVFLRTVVVWHITWSVNSLAHMWGYRNYETDEASRNNLFVAMISAGEGWHNNHHADPRSARHGHGRWELDQTYLYIRGLARLGLVRDVVTPNPHLRAANATSRLKTRDYDQSPSA